jgi:formate dehydrogenase maturation protein FdhE
MFFFKILNMWDRYKKLYVERSQRICEKCSSNQIEDELHFIINCPLYIHNREIMFPKPNPMNCNNNNTNNNNFIVPIKGHRRGRELHIKQILIQYNISCRTESETE